MTIILRTLILFLFWILLSGKWELFHLGLGLFSSVAVSYFSYRPEQGRHLSISEIPRAIAGMLWYGVWLLVKIVQAACHVSWLVLSPSMPIFPQLIKHKTILKTDDAKVIFANSITLTPGTITADISGDTLTVHELDDQSSSDIRSGAMEKEIAKIFPKGEA